MTSVRNRALPRIASGVKVIERSLSRLIVEVKKTEQELRQEVEGLERESSPGYIATQQVPSPGKKKTKSVFQLKSEKLEKSKALRLAVQVRDRMGKLTYRASRGA